MTDTTVDPPDTDPAADAPACGAGHCIQCMALPAAPFAALDDHQARDAAMEPPAQRPERCMAPQTPPRIG